MVEARKIILVVLIYLFSSITVFSANNPIDSLETLLRNHPQIQEKVYVHTDNTCYFLGDTLWYKAYVVRADDMKPTNMSKILYVELLTSDGYLVERQQVIVSDKGETCGQFALQDSLYSGYYELRAYTKWQLNFNVSVKPHGIKNYRIFYTESMENDFFRDYEGLYSRVFPVYRKPKQAGDYNDKLMFARPHQRERYEKETVNVSFYPEGGALVEGIESRVAFEVADNEGKHLPSTCRLSDGRFIDTSFDGRGTFSYTPGKKNLNMKVKHKGKTWSFSLPEPQPTGSVINYEPIGRKLSVASNGVAPACLVISCRGRVAHFERLAGDFSNMDVSGLHLPTGVNDIVVYDENALPIASRQIFVNNKDVGRIIDMKLMRESNDSLLTSSSEISPYEAMRMEISGKESLNTVSVSVRDMRSDEPSYDDGNIMTDMLLSGDLKGFVAHPAYYFESDDEEHTKNLDLLMMVQGWQKYKREDKLRYVPEKNLVYSGQILEIPDNAVPLELHGVGDSFHSIMYYKNGILRPFAPGKKGGPLSMDWGRTPFNKGKRRGDIIVEAEIVKEGEVVGNTMRVDDEGRFSFHLPFYYDKAILFVTAYHKKDSVKHSMISRKDKYVGREDEYPEFYIKQDKFFPIFSKPYSWYQKNVAEMPIQKDETISGDFASNNTLAGNHLLDNVTIKSKRRSKRALDMSKPAMVRDAYELYNDVTDYGLSYGIYDPLRYPMQLATYLVGYMEMNTIYKIRSMIVKSSYFRNYMVDYAEEFDDFMSERDIKRAMRLNRAMNVRTYTDFDMRTGMLLGIDGGAAITFSIEPVPEGGKRYTYRDRRYVYPGYNYAEEFYSPDYSHSVPPAPTDYRRTLYWNPNAKLAEDGTFTATFYGNSRECRVKVSAAGVGTDGQLYYTK